MKTLKYTLFACLLFVIACAPPPFKEVHTYYYVNGTDTTYFTDEQLILYKESNLHYKVKRGGPRFKSESYKETINNPY